MQQRDGGTAGAGQPQYPCTIRSAADSARPQEPAGAVRACGPTRRVPPPPHPNDSDAPPAPAASRTRAGLAHPEPRYLDRPGPDTCRVLSGAGRSSAGQLRRAMGHGLHTSSGGPAVRRCAVVLCRPPTTGAPCTRSRHAGLDGRGRAFRGRLGGAACRRRRMGGEGNAGYRRPWRELGGEFALESLIEQCKPHRHHRPLLARVLVSAGGV